MAITIITKNSDVAGLVPSAGQLVKGELAVNVTDKTLYTLDAANNVVLLSSGSIFTTPVTVTVNSASTAVVVTQTGAGGGMRITNTGAGNSLLVEDSANPDATPFLVDATGAVVNGHTAAVDFPDIQGTQRLAKGQQLANTYAGSTFGIASYVNAGNSGASITLAQSRNTTVGSQNVVSSNDTVGALQFAGSDGTAFIRAASIFAQVDGTPGTNNMPGRLVFSTTADGAATPTERMRIDSSGNVGVGSISLTAYRFRIGGNITGSTTAYGISPDVTVSSDVTSTALGFHTNIATQAATFTLANLRHYSARQSTIGLNSTVTNQFGYYVDSTLTGATNNYGFYSNIPAGTGDWNFYANGTATNYFGGNTIVEVTDNTNAALRITQLGTGNALLIEDSTNPDSSPFAVDATGNTNIGTTGVAAKLYVSGNAAQNIAALTDAATIAVDMGTANNFSVTLGGNRTLGNPTNLLPGQSGIIYITQDGTGSRTLAYSSFWDFSNGTAPTLTTTAGAVDALIYSVRTSTAIVSVLINNVG